MSLIGLIPATWRGIPFYVSSLSTRVGRRQAVHEFPGRDVVWVEDLGRAGRMFGFTGYLAGPLADALHASFVAAVEQAGTGTLSHPALGVFTCSLLSCVSTVSDDGIGLYRLQLEFLESAAAGLPTATADTGSAVELGALNLLAGSAAAFVATVATPLAIGAAVAGRMGRVLQAWADLPAAVASDAGAIFSSVQGLAPDLGRYSSGNGAAPPPAGSTAASLLASTLDAGDAVASAAAGIAAPASAAATAADVQALAGLARAGARDPAAQIRLLAPMASFTYASTASAAPIGAAIVAAEQAAAALARQSALAEIARAAAAYTPDSHDAADALRGQLAALFDAEIDAATDVATVAALREVRTAVLLDIQARGGSLAPLRSFSFNAALPALALAQLLYQDGARADDLIRRAEPVHPAFMPTDFIALAA